MLKNKIIVITGGAGLIGTEFVKTVAQNGGIAVLADINQTKGNQIKRSLSKKFDLDNIQVVKLDITNKQSISELINKLHKQYDRIDALVNNAYPRNKNYGREFLAVEYQDFCKNVNTHLGGYFLTSQQFVRYFIKQGYGNIVNIASVYGIIAPKFSIYQGTKMTMPVEYAAVKSAIIGFTKYVASYCQGKNIKINSISPGGIFDGQPQSFLGRYRANCLNKGMLDKHDLNGTLLYLLSDMSEFINGQNIVVDDGFTL